MEIDNDLLKYLDKSLEDLFKNIKNKIDENEKNKYINNSNYIYHTIKYDLDNNHMNLTNEDKNVINYKLRLNDICFEIRKKYIWYIALNSKINHIYNVKNEYLIFMGQNYLFIKYLIKEKQFIPLVTGNYISNNSKNYNKYEIKNISEYFIILNNIEEKIIYFIEINTFLILNKQFNYFLNVIGNDNYLLFDNVKNNEVQFSLIKLTDLSNEDNNILLNLFNFKLDTNLPKIIMNNNLNNFIYLFDNNQLCLTEYIYKNNEIKNNYKENIKEIIIRKNGVITPKIDSFSEVYSKDYEPSKLFSEERNLLGYYYCSKNSSNAFIIFDCLNEYFFKYFTITFLPRKENCRPKNFKVSILDDEKNTINSFTFINDTIESLVITYYLKNKGRFLKFDLIDNHGGDYIIIKNLKLNVVLLDSIEFE